MSTSNPRDGGVPTGSRLPDPSLLGAWAAEYFPEFSDPAAAEAKASRCAEKAAQFALTGDPSILASVASEAAARFSQAGKQGYSTPDTSDPGAVDPARYDGFAINKAIHELLQDSDSLYAYGSQAAAGQVPAPFSFLGDARGIFAEGERSAHEPAVPTAIIPNADYPQLSAPGFLAAARPVETGVPPTFSDSLSFSPVLAPAENEISSSFFDVQSIRNDFPILSQKVNGKDLVWLDNAATTHKPRQVIERLVRYYETENSNVHRGAHALAARSTDAYENGRAKVARFLGAPSAENIVFVRGATEGINLVANAFVKGRLSPGDEIIVSILEHHANIVPWQMLCAETGARIRVAPVNDAGELVVAEYEKLFSPRTKFVSFTHVSNALGTVTPVAELVAIAHRHGVPVLVDGAQAVSHIPVDVRALDADFYVFSGHKVFGPTGIGAVYGKKEFLEASKPWQGGGNMIADVTFERTVYQAPPARFEAGTGNIADAVGLGAAIDYVLALGMANINRYEHELLEYGTGALRKIPGVRLVGTARNKASVLSFTVDGYTTEEVGNALSREGIAVRSGHHCAQPILRRFALESTVRPSLAFYNTTAELDALAAAVWNLKSGRAAGPF